MDRLDKPALHTRIEKLRTGLGMTQPEFAEALGMDPKKGRSTINNWETRANKVKDDDLKKIAQTFHVSADWLLGLHNVESPTADVQAVCNYTGLSQEAVDLICRFKMISHTLNCLALRKKEQGVSDTPLFQLAAVFVNLEKSAILAASLVMSDDSEQQHIEATSKMEQLEIALSRYEKVCQKIPQSIFLADALLEEMHSKTDALLAKEYAEYLKIQEEKKEAPNGEHTED